MIRECLEERRTTNVGSGTELAKSSERVIGYGKKCYCCWGDHARYSLQSCFLVLATRRDRGWSSLVRSCSLEDAARVHHEHLVDVALTTPFERSAGSNVSLIIQVWCDVHTTLERPA